MRHVTLHIPADMHRAIVIVSDLDTTDLFPLFSRTSGSNPRDERLELYADHNGLNDDQNVRASLIAEAMTDQGEEPTVVTGDVFVVCPVTLAQSIVDNDADYQIRTEVRTSFREWVERYANGHGVSHGLVLSTVGEYVAELITQAEDRIQTDLVAGLAASLGVDPSEIGVIVL